MCRPGRTAGPAPDCPSGQGVAAGAAEGGWMGGLDARVTAGAVWLEVARARAASDEVGNGELVAVGVEQHVRTVQCSFDAHADDGAAVVGPDLAPVQHDM